MNRGNKILAEMGLLMYNFVMVVIAVKGISSQNVSIQNLTSTTILENGNISFICSSNTKSNSTFMYWVKTDYTLSQSVSMPITIRNGSCYTHNNNLANENMYSYECLENGNVYLLLKNVSSERNGEIWKCSFGFGESVNSKTIEVQVPVTSANINYENRIVTMQENATLNLNCKTSPSRPPSNVNWFIWSLSSPDDKRRNITHMSNLTTKTKAKNLTVSVSVLTYIPERSVNSWIIYCLASNIQGRNITSEEKTMNVTYPPDGPPEILGFQNDSVYSIIENDVGHLTCNVTGGNPLPTLIWNCFNGSGYNVSSETSKTTSKEINVTWTAVRGSKSCSCMSNHPLSNQTAVVRFYVQHPPDDPLVEVEGQAVGAIVSIIQNNTLTLKCESISEPVANFTWTVPGKPKIYDQTCTIENVTQNGTYICTAINIMRDSRGEQRNGKANKSIEVDILFPPNEPVFRYGNRSGQSIRNNTIVVVQGDTFAVICISRGNPLPVYMWQNRSPSDVLKVTSVKSSFVTKCTARNMMNETVGDSVERKASSNLSVIVLYPPEVPLIRVSMNKENPKNVLGNITIKEGDTFNLTCISKSSLNPVYTWYAKGNVKNYTETIQLENMKHTERGIYSCNVSVVMKRTFGNEETASNRTDTIIDILYPDSIGYLENKSIPEGSSINITCPILRGNPTKSSVFWTKGYPWLWNQTGSILKLPSISRVDDGIYTCTLHNLLQPSIGNITKSESNIQFHLDVLYKAQVIEFYIENQSEEKTLTVNETENVTFTCKTDSNPFSTSNISLNGNILNVSERNTLVYIRESVQCSDSGTYICSATNNLNYGVTSKKVFTLNVNCSPRPSQDVELRVNVTSKRSTSVTLSFTATAYPEPGASGYIWNYIKGQERVRLANNTNVEISTSFLQTNLTIRNITEDNYGQYVLQIINKFGVYEQFFNLIPTERKQFPEEAGPVDISGLVAGIVTSVVIVTVVLIVLSVYIFRKRNVKETEKLIYQNIPFSGNVQRKKKTPDKLNVEENVEETCLDCLQEVDDAPIITREPTEYYNSPDKIEMIDRIKVSELFSYVLGKDEDRFGADYQKLPTELTQPFTFARKPENLPLNRYNGIYPYDHSRVKLRENPDFFINACYIDGYKRSKAYIASLGPTANTTYHFKTFWEMIWHEKSDIIVMLTNLREPSGMKCERYWPEVGNELYGDVCVSNQNVEVFAEYTVRSFIVSKDEERRTLTHLHYTAWPDKKVPEDATSLLEFRQRIRTTPTSSEGPIVVHCSAGIGRTGTLIAIDRLIAEGQCVGSVNVFECVNSMREQRVKMVQTLEQYIYIYKSLVNALALDCGIVSVEDIQEYIDLTNYNVYSRHYQQLKQSVETDTKEDLEARSENGRQISKNRHGADIPAGRFRVMLYLNRDSSSSDYINAVYMNSFRKKDYFIVAQSPLLNTVEDFICMIYQENCTCIVTMEDLKEPGTDVGVYLPAEKHTLTFGNFKVSCTRLETKHHCVIRKVIIEYIGKYESGKKTFYHFQYTKWTVGNDTPVNSKAFVKFVTEVEEYATQFNEEMSHMLVHCLKANVRSGLFCAVQILTEKLKYERQVNVSNTVRHMRARRQTAITSREQLKFCYRAACDYVQTFKR